MKFFIDNNLPFSLAIALDILIQPRHEAIHVSRKFSADTPDIEWISTLIQEGGWVILTHDGFKEYAIERKALVESGLVVYWLKGKQWNPLTLLDKNLAVLEWTKALLDHAQPALEKARTTGKGAAWSIRYKANNRRYSFDRESF